MMDFEDHNDVLQKLSVAERLCHPGYLQWLLIQYLKEIEILQSKLARPDISAEKQLTRANRLHRLQTHCAPFVVSRLQQMNQPLDQSVLALLAA